MLLLLIPPVTPLGDMCHQEAAAREGGGGSRYGNLDREDTQVHYSNDSMANYGAAPVDTRCPRGWSARVRAGGRILVMLMMMLVTCLLLSYIL